MAEKAKITSGIYVWINKITRQALVGQSLHLRRRKEVHICTANKGAHHNPYFQNAWTKYQRDSFEFVILELIEDAALLTAYEQSYLDYYRTLSGGVYNLKGPVDTPRTGSSHTDKARASISKAQRVRKRTAKEVSRLQSLAFPRKRVERICMTTGKTKEYEAIFKVREDGFAPSSVSKCCLEQMKNHRGYYWRFKNE